MGLVRAEVTCNDNNKKNPRLVIRSSVLQCRLSRSAVFKLKLALANRHVQKFLGSGDYVQGLS